MCRLLRRVKERYPNKDVWALHRLSVRRTVRKRNASTQSIRMSFYSMIDVLVDGPFIEEQKDITLKFKGSANQRVIDMEKTERQERCPYWNLRNMIRGFEIEEKIATNY